MYEYIVDRFSICQHFESRRIIYSYLDFGLPYIHTWISDCSSSADCTRELFQGLKRIG